MEENKEDKKESIDEILTDLNSLLNKMPAIISDIKMPDVKPSDLSAIAKEEPNLPEDKSVSYEPPEPAYETMKLDPEEARKLFPEAGEPAGPKEALPEITPLAAGDVNPEAFVLDPSDLGLPSKAQPKTNKSFETTKDFGVPDIDALMNLSDEPAAGQSGGEDARPTEAPMSEENKKPEGAAEPTNDDLSEFEKSLNAQLPGEPEKAPEPAAGLVIEPAAGQAPAPVPAAGITSADQAAGLELSLGETLPSPEADKTLEAPGGIELEPHPSVAAPDPAGETSPAGGLTVNPPAADSDKTLVIEPNSSVFAQGGGQADGDKTVVYDSEPGMTSRRFSGDIGEASAKTPPGNVATERVKNVAFMHSSGDDAFCAELLNTLDAICLRSKTKPMFVKRAFVRVCEPDIKANYALQITTDAQALGLVCVGAVPQDMVYEMENAFTTAGLFFRHVSHENFGHTFALDMVSDIILR